MALHLHQYTCSESFINFTLLEYFPEYLGWVYLSASQSQMSLVTAKATDRNGIPFKKWYNRLCWEYSTHRHRLPGNWQFPQILCRPSLMCPEGLPEEQQPLDLPEVQYLGITPPQSCLGPRLSAVDVQILAPQLFTCFLSYVCTHTFSQSHTPVSPSHIHTIKVLNWNGFFQHLLLYIVP